MTESAIRRITLEFYSHFCGVDLNQNPSGLHITCTPRRDEVVKGLGCRYPVYILEKEGLLAAACSPRYGEEMESLRGLSADEALAAVRQRWNLREVRLMVFRRERVKNFDAARVLEPSQYSLYEAFFRRANPQADPAGWLREYFTEKAGMGYFTGYLKDGQLVSVCDAPDMPYMEGIIQHTGIHTLAGERGKGFGKYTAALAAHQLLGMGVCPQWECRDDNPASRRLALSIGYVEYARAYILQA